MGYGAALTAANIAAIASAVRTELTTELGRIDVAVSTRNATAPDNAGITAIAGYLDTEVAAIKAKTDLIPASPAAAGEYTSAIASIPTTPLLAADARLNNLDAAVSSRLATAGYTAPSNTTIAAIDARLPADPADQSAIVAAIPTAAAIAAAVMAEVV